MKVDIRDLKFDPLTGSFAINVANKFKDSENARGIPGLPEAATGMGNVGIALLAKEVEDLRKEVEEGQIIVDKFAAIMAELEEMQREVKNIIAAQGK